MTRCVLFSGTPWLWALHSWKRSGHWPFGIPSLNLSNPNYLPVVWGKETFQGMRNWAPPSRQTRDATANVHRILMRPWCSCAFPKVTTWWVCVPAHGFCMFCTGDWPALVSCEWATILEIITTVVHELRTTGHRTRLPGLGREKRKGKKEGSNTGRKVWNCATKYPGRLFLVIEELLSYVHKSVSVCVRVCMYLTQTTENIIIS